MIFLKNLIGLEDVQYTSPQIGSMLPSPGPGRPLSDLDQISAIMSGIHTGNDAINFFARYGSDTPVIHSILSLDFLLGKICSFNPRERSKELSPV